VASTNGTRSPARTVKLARCAMSRPISRAGVRSQIASVTRLKWKSCVMTWAGAAITLLGVYALLLQMKWL